MMSYMCFGTFFLSLIFFNGAQCQECNFFNNITVNITPKSRVPHFKARERRNFYGCFEQKQFDQNITGLAVVDQDVFELGDHAVHNLPYLTDISFTGCDIKKITVRAFENLPKLRVVNIIDSNLTSVSKGVFNDLESVQEINLSQNKISDMTSFAVFGHMPSLKYVNLSKNKLREIYSLWFFESPNIILLYLSYNEIQSIQKSSFADMPNLKDLFLDYNKITYIEDETFQNLGNMEILSLQHNRISQLSADIIGDKFQVQLLQLNANFLNYLPRKLLEKLSVTRLELEGNPWICPCLDQIHKWMLKTNVTLKNNGFCSSNIPQCFYSAKATHCSETVDSQMTKTFLKSLTEIDPPIEEECANLT